MNNKLKRLSKSTISVLLSLLMVISTVTVGIIATSAAFVDDDPVGTSVHVNTISGGFGGCAWADYTTTDDSTNKTVRTDVLYLTKNDQLLGRNGSIYWHPDTVARDVQNGNRIYASDDSSGSGKTDNAYYGGNAGTKIIYVKYANDGNSYEKEWMWVADAAAPSYYIASDLNSWTHAQLSFSGGNYSVTYNNVSAGEHRYQINTSSGGWGNYAPNSHDTSYINRQCCFW